MRTLSFSETPRCLLREINHDDLAEIESIFSENQDFLDKIGLPGKAHEMAQDIVMRGTLPPNGLQKYARHLLVLDRKTHISIGVLCLYLGYPSSSCLYIGEWILRPSWQGMGLGREVIHLLEKAASTPSWDEIRLAVNYANWRGLRYWFAMGYRELTKIVGDPEKEGPFLTRLEFRKQLHSHTKHPSLQKIDPL